jgi:large subunit ribosomal protein L21e
MTKKKSIRTRGKIKLSRYFQELEKGDSVIISIEQSIQSSFPKRFQGRTGIVEEKRGKNYIIEIKDGDKIKKFIINPIHLKKIKLIKK